MENEEERSAKIQLLPYDIIVLVLEYTSITDIVRFGSTCKQFNELVKDSHGLWKSKLKNMVNRPVYCEIEKSSDGKWFNEMKKYMNLQSEILDRIIDMGAYYFYMFNTDINLYDIRQFLNNSYTNGLSYYCTINILQEFVKKANKNTLMRFGNKLYTLTEMYYSKIALRHLFHPYLSLKWVHTRVKGGISPELVLNFFVQWVDPLKLYPDEEVTSVINELADMVETELKKISPNQALSIAQLCASGDITEAQIIAAISHVIYKEKRITPVAIANLETLDINRVIKLGCGHDVAIAAIYHAVAKKFGVCCELIAFPDHLFLEFRGSQHRTNQRPYRIELNSGKLVPKRTCPFANSDNSRFFPNSCKYCPNSLLQSVISAFLLPLANYKTWYMQNANYLMEFINPNPTSASKYKHYLPYLFNDMHLPVLATPIDVTCLTDEQLKTITLISYLTKSSVSQREQLKDPDLKNKILEHHRSGEVKYAVGMVLQHRAQGYLCVVRSWERHVAQHARDLDLSALRDGPQQPLYLVVTIDQQERYLAQELLMDVARPTRLYHLEDIIANEFSHFNGFAYEPNTYKQSQYPEDLTVSEQYRIRAEQLYGHNRSTAC